MTSTFADKSGRGLFFAALNKAAAVKGYKFAQSDLELGPVADSTNPARESEVAYSAQPDSRFEGSAIAFYNRIDLTELFLNGGIEVVQVADVGFTSVGEVVDALNVRYSLQFGAEDIEGLDGAVVDNVVVLRATPTSYGFKGQVSVQLVEGKTPLSEVIVDPVLGDLTLPVDLPSYLTEPMIIVGEVALKGKKENGTLLNGSSNPAGQLTTASNGELELALGARIWKSANLIEPVDGKYTISIADNQDWNWPICIALLQEERAITDLYDVTLKVKVAESGVELPFTLHRDEEGVFHFINEEHDLDIKDNASTPAGDVTQNIQRHTFYRDQLQYQTANGLGAALGDFTISLEAERREGLVEKLVCSIDVTVTASPAV